MKTIIVTGDSRGLGAAITQELLSDEYEVIGLSRNGSEEVSSFEKEYLDRFNHINFDLENSSKIEELYKQELKPHGPIHGLVNNAAMPYDDIVTNIDRDILSTMFEVNVISPMMFTKYTLRDMMLNRTEGSIVHISSVSTATGYKGLSMYGATKGALESFSLGVAREWGERGIRSNCIAPGFMNTEMTSTLTEEQKDRIYNRTGLGEPTSQESVAKTVRYLLSDAAHSITGETLRIDSGTL